MTWCATFCVADVVPLPQALTYHPLTDRDMGHFEREQLIDLAPEHGSLQPADQSLGHLERHDDDHVDVSSGRVLPRGGRLGCLESRFANIQLSASWRDACGHRQSQMCVYVTSFLWH